MSMRRWDPLRDLLRLQERMNRLFEESLSRGRPRGPRRGRRRLDPAWPTSTRPPKASWSLMELPGVEQDDVEVQVDGAELVVRGERRLPGPARPESFHRMERSYGAFSRRFSCTESVDPAHVTRAVPGRPAAAGAAQAPRARGARARREARVQRRGLRRLVPRKELGEILLEADLINEASSPRPWRCSAPSASGWPASSCARTSSPRSSRSPTWAASSACPPVDLSKTEIDLSLLDCVPLELCERHLVFPVRVEGTRLQLAMSDPMDHTLVSEIEFKTGVRLAPMIALESSIKNAIMRGAARPEGGPAHDRAQRADAGARRRRRAGARRARPPRPPDPPPRVAPLEERERGDLRDPGRRAAHDHAGPAGAAARARRWRRCRPSWRWTTTRRSCG